MEPTGSLDQLAAGLDPEWQVAVGKWFGLPCLKVGGKVFAAEWQGGIAFKLAGEALAQALQIEGAQLFNPRGRGQPMRAWVQLPASRSDRWGRFAGLACAHVAGAAQARKDELIQGLVEARAQVIAAAVALPPEAWDEIFLGHWSIKDLLGHLVGWDHTNREAVQQILAGQRPDFWAHYDRDWQSYNALLVARHRLENVDELLASLVASHRQLVNFLRSLPADAFVKQRRITTLLRAETQDEHVHAGQVLCFLGHNAGRSA
jgi:uncharacterized damage-inducible protein DinB